MIVIHDSILESKEQIKKLITYMEKDVYKDDLYNFVNLFHDYLMDCFDADEKLQEMVTKNLSDEYICFSILPVKETEDFDSFGFELVSKTKDKIKKREEKMFENYCNICFGSVKTYKDRLLDLVQE